VSSAGEPIVLFRTGDITDYYTEEELGENFVFPDKINDLIAKTPGIIAFFSDKYINKEFKGKELDINKITVYKFYPVKNGFLPLNP
jgi:phosphate transport system permease protein